MKIGSWYMGEDNTRFTVWAPFIENMGVNIGEQKIPMEKDGKGYWSVLADAPPGSLYTFDLYGKMDRPDPASYYQPQGVHGPSQVIDHNFSWDDINWKGIPLNEMMIYELHTGTFTPQGDLKSIITRLDDLLNLGVNTVELMPVAQFPGERNWGYDGAYPFAVQNSYGGPHALKAVVNACHQKGMAVILDVVYNHLGPEGNYLRDFGPYFTDRYKTPWGDAINFDGPYSDEVRQYFVQNALYWFQHFHMDALRLDAIHGIFDMSPKPFLQELAERVDELSQRQGRKFYLIAESDLNDVKVIRPRESGYRIHAQWNDDFHHSLHALLTGERQGYYQDFGSLKQLVKALRDGFVYDWQYSAYRKRHYGSSSADRPAHQFVVFSQNHDQVGNRLRADRLSTILSFEALKLVAGAVILSPNIPLLFMGEEYGEESPFLYFVSHTDPELVQAVREGRKEEFSAFEWGDGGDLPDPYSEETFSRCKLSWDKRREGKHKILYNFYKELIRMRKEIPSLHNLSKEDIEVREEGTAISVRRWLEGDEVFYIMNFGSQEVTMELGLQGSWVKLLDSCEEKWGGKGSSVPVDIGEKQVLNIAPFSLVVFRKVM
ncbi:MAG: malto-oligosyltrehalose trehalohydrolase [Halobacteriota archaeon]